MTDRRQLMSYCTRGFDHKTRYTLWRILKCEKPAIPDRSAISQHGFMGLSTDPGKYLLNYKERKVLINFGSVFDSELDCIVRHDHGNNSDKDRIFAMNRALSDLFYSYESVCNTCEAYAAVNELSESLGVGKLFSDPYDIQLCAREHSLLLTEIPLAEGDLMFGAYKAFDPAEAFRRNGVIDWNRYRMIYEEKLYDNRKRGQLKPGDLISLKYYPFEADGMLRPITWQVLETDGDTVLLMSLYAYRMIDLSSEQFALPDAVSAVLDHLNTMYEDVFDDYNCRQLVCFEDGRRLSLLTENDLIRLGREDKGFDKVYIAPYFVKNSNEEALRDWLVLSSENKPFPFCRVGDRGPSPVALSHEPVRLALRPIIKADINELRKY